MLTKEQRQSLLENGYVTLPGAVPAKAVEAALREIDPGLVKPAEEGEAKGDKAQRDAHRSGVKSSPAFMDLLLKSPLWEDAQELAGGALQKPTEAQVSERPASEKAPARPLLMVESVHCDKGVEEEFRQWSSTMLIMVLLSDMPKKGMGNPAVSPGSHLRLAEYFKSHPLVSLRENIPEGAGLAAAQEITGKAGDALLCHYQAAHDRSLNGTADPRYVVYFRLSHKDHRKNAIKAFTEPWLEWTGLRPAARKG